MYTHILKMRALLLLIFVAAAVAEEQASCNQNCSCRFAGEGGTAGVTKHEVMAGTLGTLVPLVTGGVGFGLWRLLKGGDGGGGDSDVSDAGSEAPIAKSRGSSDRNDPWARRGSSPPPYDNLSRRRGSTPLSLFEEGEHDDFLDSSMPRNGSTGSFGGPDGGSNWRRGSVAPSIASNVVNIHRPQRDGLNQWLG